MAIAKDPRVHVVVADQCQYGLESPTPGGGKLPALKPTRFMTSSHCMAARLSLRCNLEHKNQQLVGVRCKDAAFYPLGLIKAILMGMKDESDFDNCTAHLKRESRDLVNAVTSSAGSVPPGSNDATEPICSSVPYVNGIKCTIAYKDENFKAGYIDEYTGEVLDPEQIKAAIIDELD